MDIHNLQQNWEEFGKSDPLWSILTWEGKKDNKWNPDEFFKYGEWDISRIQTQIQEIESYSLKFDRCLDFGCGVGRLTIPLSKRFKEAYGVDIAHSMISRANGFSKDLKNCRFHINQQPNLKLFESDFFDLIVSLIVLQHIDPKYQVRYIQEFIRIIKPGGMIVFQLPDGIKLLASSEYYNELNGPEMEMHGMNKDEVISLVLKSGGKVLNIIDDTSCGDECPSYRYFVCK